MKEFTLNIESGANKQTEIMVTDVYGKILYQAKRVISGNLFLENHSCPDYIYYIFNREIIVARLNWLKQTNSNKI
jgi:hypothetical protein